MNRQSLLAHFEKLLPLAASWVEALEARILRDGVPLNAEELSDAEMLGVREPGRVRLLCLTSGPAPEDPLLRAAARAVQFLTPATRGMALRHGIFVRADCWRERALVAHELAHCEQYERLGGIEPFLRQYLSQCLTLGYPAAPLEQEAIAATSRLRDRGLARRLETRHLQTNDGQLGPAVEADRIHVGADPDVDVKRTA